ncbi:hypothetical protein DEM27_12480 [Metarhizobium album]|uniref:DUF6680 domain-containing protein n=2 Tax=Metarhizobium album TaxID=2182425 RepID=A0A2U2DSD2_9HYPH|nr:hypothetical protein DEM27_12480 [Rhizobium album]
MDWSNIDWAVVAATFIGPIFAVVITLWYQERSSRMRSRQELFVAMMRTRRHPTNADFVGALNLLPVHFYADKSVMERYVELIAVFDDLAWFTPQARPRLNEQADLRVAYLLSAMSKAVGRPVEQLQILRGAYAPQGWQDEEQALKSLRAALSEIASGVRPLRVWVDQLHQSAPSLVKSEQIQEDTSNTVSEPAKDVV